MSDKIFEIEGFDKLIRLIKKLDDRTKRREMVKILGQVANPTLKAARELTPRNTGSQELRGKAYPRKRRQIGKTIIESKTYTPGYGSKSIAKAVMRRTSNAVVVVGPRSKKNFDGYFLRQWVIPGTKNFTGNDFIEKAYQRTKGTVTAESEKKFKVYIQKQIKRLKNA